VYPKPLTRPLFYLLLLQGLLRGSSSLTLQSCALGKDKALANQSTLISVVHAASSYREGHVQVSDSLRMGDAKQPEMYGNR